MRRLSFAVVTALLILPVVHAQGANEPSIRKATIKWPEIEVRSGPSDKYPATGILRKGAQVHIRNKPATSGYLEILPPPGSVSWVPKAVVTKLGNPVNGRQAFVISGDDRDGLVPIYPGGMQLADGPLQHDLKMEVRRGTQGYIRGNPVRPAWSDVQYYPIDPLPGESRYILANALNEPTEKDEIAIRSRSRQTPGQLTSRPARDVSDLFQQARRADEEGRIDEAIDLYQQVAREVSATNDAQANYCATRIYELRQRRGSFAPGMQTSRRTDPNAPPEPPLPGTSNYNGSIQPAAPQPQENRRWTGPGFLRRTAIDIDKRPSYALIDRNGRVLFFVTAPGVNLEPFVERWVDLYGVVEIRPDVRGGDYMRVSHVHLYR